MDWLILIVSELFIFLSSYSKYVYKSKCVPHTSEFGFIMGSVAGTILDGIAWYYLFKSVSILF
jgi:hypothetical protein